MPLGTTGECQLAQPENAGWHNRRMLVDTTGECQLAQPENAGWHNWRMPVGTMKTANKDAKILHMIKYAVICARKFVHLNEFLA
jgi:SRSO17 transposase